jgi:hypothetical protein
MGSTVLCVSALLLIRVHLVSAATNGLSPGAFNGPKGISVHSWTSQVEVIGYVGDTAHPATRAAFHHTRVHHRRVRRT